MKLLSNYRTNFDIASELRCHVRTVDRAINRGDLVAAKVGRLWLVDVKKSRANLAAIARKQTRQKAAAYKKAAAKRAAAR
jgi:hypothetical protein